MTTEPVAAASIGQVYKAKLRSTGEDVALKIQRPGILETVSLDLCLIRKVCIALQGTPFIRSDLPSILDEWASRFYEEMNYVQEAENGLRFMRLMAPLREVTAPRPIFDHTSRRVLTMEWINGYKLVDAEPDEINRLVNIGVTCYLMQLLETGFFHADPHPGNMLRTEDGKLCIIDFGLMSVLEDYQKYGMIGSITHLIKKDYYQVVEDFEFLGFLPEDHPPVSEYVPTFKTIFDQALVGGGAKAINFNELSNDLAKITFDLPFRLPPFFALVIRAIGVLEGIALNGDPDFAIIDESYPYIAKRLLTDDSEYMKKALNDLIMDKDGALNIDQLIDLLESFETFAKINSATINQDLMNMSRKQMSVNAKSTKSAETTREALIFFFSDDGQYIRDLLEDTVVDGFDSLSKEAVGVVLQRMGLYNTLIPLPNVGRKKPEDLHLINMNDEDRKRVNTILKMWNYFGPSPQNMGAMDNSQANYLSLDNLVNLGSEVGPYLPLVYPQMVEYFSRIFNKLYVRGKARIATDLNISPNLIPDIFIPPNIAKPGGAFALPRTRR